MNVTVLDNKNLEDKLTLGKQYEVKGESTGDFYDYYLLLCDDGSKHWVEKYRVGESKSRAILEEMGMLQYEIKTPTDVIPPTPKKSLEEAFGESVTDDERMRYYATTLLRCLPKCLEVDIDKYIVNLPYVKPPIERIICIPDENGHIVDLQRVQYISPVDKGSYKVTLVSGWEMPLTDKLYSREKLIGLWRGLQNKPVAE